MFIKSSKNSQYYILKFTSSNKHAFQNNINKVKLLLQNSNIPNFVYSTLPTKKKKYYILRSPHVYKKSIETFEEQIYTSTFKIQIFDSKAYLQMFYLLNFLKQNTPDRKSTRLNSSHNNQSRMPSSA